MAIAVAYAVGFDHPLAVALAADVAATCVIFAFSFAFDNASFYDAYWSAVPPVLGVYWIANSDLSAADVTRQWVVLGLVTVWAVRLTYNWSRWWNGLEHEDWRYVDFRGRTGRAYWLVAFAGIHLFPTLWVFAGCLPLYVALAAGSAPFGALDWLATAVTSAAIALEARADRELFDFRQSRPAPQQTLVTGLRRYCRHPNYLGEMGFWWGLFLFGLSAAPSWWWTGVGAASITLMFRFVSLPLIEAHMRERRPDYAVHAEHTPMLIPRPPRRSAS